MNGNLIRIKMLKIILTKALLFFLLLYSSEFVWAQSSADADDDLLYRKFRVTLVPGLSTNGVDADRYNAKYSLNLLAGYHGGLEGYELGLVNINKHFSRGMQAGLLNISGGEMSGVQLSGFGNLSSGELSGLQFSGMGNISGSSLQGLQFAGLGNLAAAEMSGIQMAGLMNISGNQIEGLQFSGIGNLSGGDLSGLQFAGIFNLSGGHTQGLQFAGITNITGGSAEGITMSGITNISQHIVGISGAGIINISGSFEGIQAAGVANIAGDGQGLQIGLINYARHFEGVPFGLISYYENGRKNLDLWFTDGGFTHLGLTLGTSDIYNKISIGYNPLISDRDVWALSWSIGTYQTLDKAWNRPKLGEYFSTRDFTFQRIVDGKWSDASNAILSFKYLLGKNTSPNTALYLGPSLNLQISKEEKSSDYSWYTISEAKRAGRDVRFWIGFTGGIRLFGQ
jgi:hypothetical protein